MFVPRYLCTHQCTQWTEGEIDIARVEAGGFILVGADDAPNGEGARLQWSSGMMVRSFTSLAAWTEKLFSRSVQHE